MRSNYNNFGNLEQLVKGTLMQAEQAIRSGRMSSMQPTDKNTRLYRAESGNYAPASGEGPQQAGIGASARPEASSARSGSQPEPGVYREGPDRPVSGTTTMSGTTATSNAGINAGEGSLSSSTARKLASVDYTKLLKLDFNEENLLSGFVMAEVLGRPRCLRRGRW